MHYACSRLLQRKPCALRATASEFPDTIDMAEAVEYHLSRAPRRQPVRVVASPMHCTTDPVCVGRLYQCRCCCAPHGRRWGGTVARVKRCTRRVQQYVQVSSSCRAAPNSALCSHCLTYLRGACPTKSAGIVPDPCCRLQSAYGTNNRQTGLEGS